VTAVGIVIRLADQLGKIIQSGTDAVLKKGQLCETGRGVVEKTIQSENQSYKRQLLALHPMLAQVILFQGISFGGLFWQ
jgi:hypothetical protein